jgi:hypothetical protein
MICWSASFATPETPPHSRSMTAVPSRCSSSIRPGRERPPGAAASGARGLLVLSRGRGALEAIEAENSNQGMAESKSGKTLSVSMPYSAKSV